MTDRFREEEFPTAEELIRRLQERSDDFEQVSVMVTNDLPLSGPGGQSALAKNCCGTILLCNGETLLIHRDVMETLLNDGILHKMKIPISLVPREAR